MEESLSDSEDDVLYDIDYSGDVPSVYIDAFTYTDPTCESQLSTAIRLGQLECVQEILRNPSKTNLLSIIDNKGNNIIHKAVLSKNKEIVQLLIQQSSVNINARNWEGMTPLYLSLMIEADYDLIETLVSGGCDVTIPNNEKSTPLHVAVKHSNSNVGDLLIKNGAQIDAIDFDGFTPMHEAVYRRSVENIYMLLYYNADLSIREAYNNHTPILMAINLNYDESLLQILLDYLPDYNIGSNQVPLLIMAIRRHQYFIAKELISRGAFVNICNGSVCIHEIIIEHLDLFKIIWPLLDLNVLLQNHENYLGEYSETCNYESFEFVNCLNTMFSSSIVQDLCERSNLTEVCRKLHKLKVESDVCVSIIYIMLSFGTTVTYEDLYYIYDLYGFDEKFDIFLKLNIEVHQTPKIQSNPMAAVVTDIRKNFYEIVKPYFWGPSYSKFNIKSFGYYYNLKYIFKHIDFKCSLDDVPSLMEFSRDKFRKVLSNKWNGMKPFNYYTILKENYVPPSIIDIITLKKRIY